VLTTSSNKKNNSRCQSEFERTTLLSETCPLSRHTRSTPTVVTAAVHFVGSRFAGYSHNTDVEVNRCRFPGTGDLLDPGGSEISLDSVTGSQEEFSLRVTIKYEVIEGVVNG
jgi:hypothetical protein